jgi:hypothetical protein
MAAKIALSSPVHHANEARIFLGAASVASPGWLALDDVISVSIQAADHDESVGGGVG